MFILSLGNLESLIRNERESREFQKLITKHGNEHFNHKHISVKVTKNNLIYIEYHNTADELKRALLRYELIEYLFPNWTRDCFSIPTSVMFLLQPEWNRSRFYAIPFYTKDRKGEPSGELYAADNSGAMVSYAITPRIPIEDMREWMEKGGDLFLT